MVNLLLFAFLVVIFLFYKSYSKSRENYVGNLRAANELDRKRAVKYGLEMMCKKRGYKWVQGGDEFVYDCKHTKDTCENESVYPTPNTPYAVPKYYEWRDSSDEEFFETGEALVEAGTGRLLSSTVGQSSDFSRKEDVIRSDGVCILGNEPFRKFCEGENLRYDQNTGKCYTTKPYCNKRLLAFCDDDCFEPPVGMVLSAVFGSTLGRSVGTVFGDSIYVAACK